jgi:hypothetical protein
LAAELAKILQVEDSLYGLCKCPAIGQQAFLVSSHDGELRLAKIGIPVSIANGGTWEAMTAQFPPGHFSPTGWGVPTMLALAVSMPPSFFVGMDS